MFRENKDHLQEELFNSFSWMNPKIQASLKGTWAPLFYEHVFCKIDEAPFSCLYCLDNGRPNFPVNILLEAVVPQGRPPQGSDPCANTKQF